jgi:glutamyl-tRNA synthetase
MNWTDPRTDETVHGFRERGFLPEAFVNMLAMLGWNAGTEQEIFSMDELIKQFSIERVHKGGAKFDYEKAKWFNHQYIQRKDNKELLSLVKPYIVNKGITATDAYLEQVIGLIKDRCTLLPDFWEQGHFFFHTPDSIDTAAIKEKWNEPKAQFFTSWLNALQTLSTWDHTTLEQSFNDQLQAAGLKKGDIMLPLRIMLVGGKYGPGVFTIAEMIGKDETIKRITTALDIL